jgi:glycosyltransferase involved in cell wall biosynthesis
VVSDQWADVSEKQGSGQLSASSQAMDLTQHAFTAHCPLTTAFSPCNAKETVYTPNGTQLRKRRSGAHLQTLGLVPGGYVLYLGRFSPEKNCDLLIDAFEKTQTPFKLVLAGGSSHTDKYVARLRQHESDQIKLLDWLSGDALEEVLTNAALFVLPSDLEGLSLALLDAMGAGVCVLASDVPENCEVVEDTGFLFKRGDVPDLQRMLSLLLSDVRLREIVGGSAQQRVRITCRERGRKK